MLVAFCTTNKRHILTKNFKDARTYEQELYSYYGQNVFIDITDNEKFSIGSLTIRFRLLIK